MLSRLIRKINRELFRRSMPDIKLSAPTNKEQLLINELREKFNSIDTDVNKNKSTTHAEWVDNIKQVKNLILSKDPREFLKWEIIRYSLYISQADYASKELVHLRLQEDFEVRWLPAIQESAFGSPFIFKHLLNSSANLITHSYHVMKFEEKVNTKINNVDLVFEFGGGYGNMCKLFYNLSFNKKYLIYDLAPFSALQEYYLKSIGMTTLTVDNFLNAESGILCVSEMEDLKLVLRKCATNNLKTLFLATWSLAESPLALRKQILSLVNHFTYFLFGYAENWDIIDNIKFFKDLQKKMDTVDWHSFLFPFAKGNFYLVGKTKKLEQ